MKSGDWAYSVEHEEPCRVVSVDDLWGEQTAQVWLARRDAVIRLPVTKLYPLSQMKPPTLEYLCYTSAAARILDTLQRDELIAPVEGSVIPLPHQLSALQRAISGDRIRYLLADEVGLGKTIEAGLIFRELKLRGLVKRVLVVAPAGLVNQWVSEMKTHFNEDFHLILPSHFATWRQILGVDEKENLWQCHSQVICSLDSVKPLDTRRGWTPEQVSRYNRERFEDLVSAHWDLVIIDEAHRLAGSSEQVVRYRLGEALAQASPYLLLLSATPHQGKTDAFRRLMRFLDDKALPDDDSVTHDNIAPYVIRTEKRHAINAEGQPLFKPRYTQIVSVVWDESNLEQRALYEAVTEYVREGYNQAILEKKTAIGFLMILMQRLVTSSTAAIRAALERRLEVLSLPPTQLPLFSEEIDDEWMVDDSQEQMDKLLAHRTKSVKNERIQVEQILSIARRCEAHAPDAKAESLLTWIQKLQQEENEPCLKVLVFTEFVSTQTMLAEFLGQRGYTVTCLNGSMDLETRKRVQQAFAKDSQILISTDAGGEGLNLQFCHIVVNYDLPWNPMKLEQRIGRVDRIGQKHIVRAINFALDDTVELRVREVLEEKLRRIFEEFGVDKLSDVLDSEEGREEFEQLYVRAVVSPEEAEARAVMLAEMIRNKARFAREGASLLGSTTQLDPADAQKIAEHQMPFWVEQMTLSWLRSQSLQGGLVQSHGTEGFDLVWPDGHCDKGICFRQKTARERGLEYRSVEDPRIRGLTTRMIPYVEGMPVCSLVISGISDKVNGFWSLWRVGLQAREGREQRMMPIFVTHAGHNLGPTARMIWERLIAWTDGNIEICQRMLSEEATKQAWIHSRAAAEGQGRELFYELTQRHQKRFVQEQQKMEIAFAVREKAAERVGLQHVRVHRLSRIEQEKDLWYRDVVQRKYSVADLRPVLLIAVVSRETGEVS